MADRDGTDQGDPKLTPEEAARILEQSGADLSGVADMNIEVENASAADLGDLSPSKQWEIDQAAKEHEQGSLEPDVAADIEQANEGQTEPQFEQQATNPEQTSVSAEADAEMSGEDVSLEELGNLSPMDTPGMEPEPTWVERIEAERETEQAAKEYEQRPLESDVAADTEQTSESQLEPQFEQQSTNPEHSSLLAEAHAEMSANEPEPEPPSPNQGIGPAEEVSPAELGNLSPMNTPGMQSEQQVQEAVGELVEPEIEQPDQATKQSEIEAANDNEYQPTEQDWQEYGEWVDEQHQAVEYSDEMNAVFDQYAEQGNDDQAQELEQAAER